MVRWLVERRLTDVSARLRKAREELAVLQEQADHFTDEADHLRLRSLVSETPQADAERHESRRHADAMLRARDAVAHRIADLERQLDELLDRLGTGQR